jgi:hypothetical protein
MHFSCRAEVHELGIVVDLAVDGDGNRMELRLESRIARSQFAKQVAHVARIDRQIDDAAGGDPPTTGEVNGGRQSPPAITPSRTRGGDSGNSVKRTPVASRIALATAASGGTIGTSPTPRTP